MPRTGQNPMRWVSDVHRPKPVTVTSIVYIPSRDGYWRESLPILDLCFESLRDPEGPAFDLFVFDNGSCEEVRDHLLRMLERDAIQYLLLSRHNVGKVGNLVELQPLHDTETIPQW